LPSAQCVETEEEKDDQHPKQSNDTAALLQDELTQATYRERQLQMQLDKMKDDASQLRTQLQQLSNVQKLFSDFKRRTAPIWEREMKQRDSKFTLFKRYNLCSLLGHQPYMLLLRFYFCYQTRDLGTGVDIRGQFRTFIPC